MAALVWILALLSPVGTCSAAAPHPTPQQLTGAWRLVRIEYGGTKGVLTDPFYQPDSTGIIIYDASGWMSVQISAPRRESWPVPESRPTPADATETSRKAAAFDTYYAYYGTWTLDEQSGVMTHHVASSLIPAEDGVDYRQQISFEGGRLVFTTHTGTGEAMATRRKFWQRMVPPK